MQHVEPHRRRYVAQLTLDVTEPQERWLLPEEDVPESIDHRAATELLAAILRWWAAKGAPNAVIAENFACRWDPTDRRVGVDPDVVLIDPAPDLRDGLQVWREDHPAPRVAAEIVSPSNSLKDYRDAPARYACLGTRELWVFDPLLAGPSELDGPFPLQVWCSSPGQRGVAMRRVYAGPGPVRSEELGAWLVVHGSGASARLRIADVRDGSGLWLTEAEAERACVEAERARADAERARVEVERARADALEQQLAALRTRLGE